MSDHPDLAHSLLVARRTSGPVNHEWTANQDDVGNHHELLDINETPCYPALYWQSRSVGRTLHVGTYKLNLRRLAAAGYAQEKPGRKVRLRFVRDPTGIVEIQPNESSPGLPVDQADFDDPAS